MREFKQKERCSYQIKDLIIVRDQNGNLCKSPKHPDMWVPMTEREYLVSRFLNSQNLTEASQLAKEIVEYDEAYIQIHFRI